MDYQAVSERQEKILNDLRSMNETLTRAERRSRIAEIEADLEEDKRFLLEKAKPEKRTDTMLKAIAREQSYDKRLMAIIRESVYKKMKREYEMNFGIII